MAQHANGTNSLVRPDRLTTSLERAPVNPPAVRGHHNFGTGGPLRGLSPRCDGAQRYPPCVAHTHILSAPVNGEWQRALCEH